MSHNKMSLHELTVESVLWRLEGLWAEDAARALRVPLQAVTEALERSGAYVLTFPGRGKRQRIEIFCLPEFERVRLDIPWRRCWGTGCEVMLPQGAAPAYSLRGDDPVTMWQREFRSGEISGRWPRQHAASRARA